MATTKPAAKTVSAPAPAAAPQPKPKPASKLKPAAAAQPEGGAKKVTTDITVDLVVNTEDDLRRIEFGLQKNTDDDGQPTWTIRFKLFQRADKTVDHGQPRVSLNVVVDKNLHDQAAETAKKGLSPAQAAFLAGPGAKAAMDSTKPGGKPADQKVLATLSK